jgi:hypothetical protein
MIFRHIPLPQPIEVPTLKPEAAFKYPDSDLSTPFTSYFAGWWHFDHGDHFWAKIKKKHAIYGAVNIS